MALLSPVESPSRFLDDVNAFASIPGIDLTPCRHFGEPGLSEGKAATLTPAWKFILATLPDFLELGFAELFIWCRNSLAVTWVAL